MSPQPLSWEGDPTRVPLDRPPGVVDVIVPVAGAPDELARCVASLLAWTDLERHPLVIALDRAQPPATDADGERRGPAGRRACGRGPPWSATAWSSCSAARSRRRRTRWSTAWQRNARRRS